MNNTTMKKESFSNNTWKTYLHSAICVGIMLGFRFLPPMEPITPLGMQIVGIFLGMLYGWLTVDMVWPSILGLVVLGLTEFTTVPGAFKSGFGNNTVLLTFFFFLVTNIVNDAGITTFIARRMVSAKIAKGKPWILSGMIMLTMCVLVTLVSCVAACLVIFPLIKTISEIYGFKRKEKWPVLMMIGVNYVGAIAYMLFPFKSLPAIAFGSYKELSGMDINYMQYVVMILIASVLTIALFLFICRFLIKPDVSKIIEKKDAQFEKAEALTSYQKMILGYFSLLLFFLLAPSVLPKSWPWVALLGKIGNTGTLALGIGVYLFLNFKKGLSVKQLFAKGISWEAIFLLSAALTVADAIKDESTGIQQWLIQTVEPMVVGKSVLVFVLLILVLSAVITQFANNLVTTAIFTPIVYTLGVASGNINIPALMTALILTCTLGLATPSASNPATLIFAEKDWIEPKTAMFYGWLFTLANILLVFAVIFPLASVIM